jgi:hypothetical protein
MAKGRLIDNSVPKNIPMPPALEANHKRREGFGETPKQTGGTPVPPGPLFRGHFLVFVFILTIRKQDPRNRRFLFPSAIEERLKFEAVRISFRRRDADGCDRDGRAPKSRQ